MTTKSEREKLNREYLNEKCDVHLNKLIVELLRNKPDDVLAYIYNWAANLTGNDTNQSGGDNFQQVPNAEEKHQDKEVLNVAKKDPPREDVEAPDTPRILKDVEEVYYQGNKDKGDYEAPEVDSSEEEEEGDDEVGDLDAFLSKNKKDTSNKNRESVSAEVYGSFNVKQAYVPTVVEKSEEAKERIRTRLSQAFMFAALDDTEKNIVIDAMKECKFSVGDNVITQGDAGDVLYILDSGKFKCQRRMKKDDPEDTFLKHYQPGESFGELALLYNAPRAATIIAEEEGVAFSLDRDCFNNIVKEAAVKRRERFDEFVSKIELLKDLDSYERGQLADVLNTEKFNEGDVVIKQGVPGEKFYFIETGTAKATKNPEGDETEDKVVFEYKEHDYFGELALLKLENRAANVIATSELHLAWIDRVAFKRLLGPLEELLKRNSDRYEKFTH